MSRHFQNLFEHLIREARAEERPDNLPEHGHSPPEEFRIKKRREAARKSYGALNARLETETELPDGSLALAKA